MRLSIILAVLLFCSNANAGVLLTRNFAMWSGAAPNYSELFNGSSAYLDLTTVGIANPDADFTLSAWIKPTAAQLGWIISNNTGGAGDINEFQVSFYFQANGRIGCQLGKASSWAATAVSTAVAPLNVWTHVACTFDNVGANSVIVTNWINGDNDTVSSGSGSDPTNTDLWHIGVEKGATTTLYFPGYIDDAKIELGLKYTGASYTVPTTPEVSDGNTKALYQFDELGEGSTANPIDTSGKTTASNVGSAAVSSADNPF